MKRYFKTIQLSKGLIFFLFQISDKNLPEIVRPLVYETYAKAFGVNIAEAQYQDLKHYRSLADFFVRPLKEGARKIDHQSCLVSPCDGTVLSVGTVNNGRVEQVSFL